MRGRDDHAAANQRAIDALYQARHKAIADCTGRLEPEPHNSDRVFLETELFSVADSWDHLNVDYLHSEWPPSMLS